MSERNEELMIFNAIEQLTSGGKLTRWEEIVEATGLDDRTVQDGLRALYGRRAIRGHNVTGINNPGGFELIDIRFR
jgi:hypothetical protein